MIGQSTNPRIYTQYRLYLPGSWDIIQVLEVAANYTTHEPQIINTPALAGDWEVGYCDYDHYRQAAKEAAKWYAPQLQPA